MRRQGMPADTHRVSMYRTIRLFNFNRNNRLSFSPIYDDEDGKTWPPKLVYWWLNGRIFGHYITWTTRGARKYDSANRDD